MKQSNLLTVERSQNRPSYLTKYFFRNRYNWPLTILKPNCKNESLSRFHLENQPNCWYLFERANYKPIEFDLNPFHIEIQKKEKEKDQRFVFLANELNSNTSLFSKKISLKNQDKLILYYQNNSIELVYENNRWYMDNQQSYRNEEWDSWLVYAGKIGG